MDFVPGADVQSLMAALLPHETGKAGVVDLVSLTDSGHHQLLFTERRTPGDEAQDFITDVENGLSDNDESLLVKSPLQVESSGYLILDNCGMLNESTSLQPGDGESSKSKEGPVTISLLQLDEQLQQLLLEFAASQNGDSVTLTVEDAGSGGTIDIVYYPATQSVVMESKKLAEENCVVDLVPNTNVNSNVAESQFASFDPAVSDSVADGVAYTVSNGDATNFVKQNVISLSKSAEKTIATSVNSSVTTLGDTSEDGGTSVPPPRPEEADKNVMGSSSFEPATNENLEGIDALAEISRDMDQTAAVSLACDMYRKYRLPRRKHILRKISKGKELSNLSAPQPYPEQNDPGVAPTFQNYCKGVYKIDFAMIAERIESELNYYGINQATFAHFVCQRSQTRFSELLTEARTENYYCRSKGVFEIYRRMESWLKQPLEERIKCYKQWLQERGHGSKKKGVIKKSSLALAIKRCSKDRPAVDREQEGEEEEKSMGRVSSLLLDDFGQFVQIVEETDDADCSDDDPNLAKDVGATKEKEDSTEDVEISDVDQEEAIDYFKNFAYMAYDLEDELKWFNVSRELFSRGVLGRSKSRFSEIMGEAKLQPFACKSAAVIQKIEKLCEWMSKSLEERGSRYLEWRLDAKKASSFREEPESDNKMAPVNILTESGEIFQVEGILKSLDKEENKDSVPSPFQKEILKSQIDFRTIALRLEKELKAYDVGLSLFMRNLVPDITIGAFSQMLRDAKSPNFVCKRRTTLDKFKTISDWLNQSEYERVQTYKMWKEPDAEPPRQLCVAALEARTIAQEVLKELVENELSQKEFALNILGMPSAILCMLLRKASEDLSDVTAPKSVKALLCMKDWMELGESERKMTYETWKRHSNPKGNLIKRYGRNIRQFIETSILEESPGEMENTSSPVKILMDETDDDQKDVAVVGLVQLIEHNLYKRDGSLNYQNIGTMIQQDIDLFKIDLEEIATQVVGRGEKTLGILLNHARDTNISFSYGKTIDTFQVLAEWLETGLEERLLLYSLWDKKDRSSLVIHITQSVHYEQPPFEFEMDLISLQDLIEDDNDHYFWQLMRHLEIDLEEKNCITPIFAQNFLKISTYTSFAAVQRLARRFLARDNQDALSTFKLISEWFRLSDEERTSLCHDWMRDRVDVLWRKKVIDLRERIVARKGAALEDDLPPIPSHTVLVPKIRRGRPPRCQEDPPAEANESLSSETTKGEGDNRDGSAVELSTAQAVDQGVQPASESSDETADEPAVSFFASGRPRRKATKINNYKKMQDGGLDLDEDDQDESDIKSPGIDFVAEEFPREKPAMKRRQREKNYSRKVESTAKKAKTPETIFVNEKGTVTFTTVDGKQVLLVMQRKDASADLDVAQNDLKATILEDEVEEDRVESPRPPDSVENVNGSEENEEVVPQSEMPKFSCHSCEKKFDKISDLLGHVKQHSVPKNYYCHLCNSSFVNLSGLKKHRRINCGRRKNLLTRSKLSNSLIPNRKLFKSYPCAKCGTIFPRASTLKEHLGRVHNVAQVSAQESARPNYDGDEVVFSKPQQLTSVGTADSVTNTDVDSGNVDSNLDLHNGIELPKENPQKESVHSCKICGKVLATRMGLRGHVVSVHKKLKLQSCPVCKKTMSSSQNMKRHLRTHTGEKRFQCDVCLQFFTEKKSMQVHRRLHTGERPYKCESCGKTFVQSGTYLIHKKTHEEQKKFRCEKCYKFFKTNRHLKNHSRYHDIPDSARPFQCVTCPKGFFSKDDLGRHKVTHFDKISFVCHVCHESFPERDKLLIHMASHSEAVAHCDICGVQYQDYLNFLSVVKHKKSHGVVYVIGDLENVPVTNSLFPEVTQLFDSDTSKLTQVGATDVFANDGCSIPWDCSRTNDSLVTELPAVAPSTTVIEQLDSEVFTVQMSDEVTSQLNDKLQNASVDVCLGNELTDLSRFVTVQDASGQIFNVQLDDNRLLPDFLPSNSNLAEDGISSEKILQGQEIAFF